MIRKRSVRWINCAFSDPCFQLGHKPSSDWKTAVVTLIYKNKGIKNDVNNYRGISVLPPIAKFFEKILAEQIVNYANEHNIFYSGQHGFRPGHSLETAHHKLLSDINTIWDKKSIAMPLFIEFRKAFNLVNSNLLRTKIQTRLHEKWKLSTADSKTH
jgi:hypothetical protein